MDKNYGFFRVAAAVPWVRVGDVDWNMERVCELVRSAHAKDVSLVVFPELCLTGYTCADLFFQEVLQEKVLENLEKLLKFSSDVRPAFVVGMPLRVSGKLYNVAVVIRNGSVKGIVPKTHLPNYREFYEARWFTPACDLLATEVELFNQKVPIGTDILFSLSGFPKVTLGIEICEDLWVPIPPSSMQAVYGATVIANLSASNAIVGKADYRRALVAQQSSRCISGYVYAACGVYESTTDVVFDGHALIAENGTILKESERFNRFEELVIADIDVNNLVHDRECMNTFQGIAREFPKKFRTVNIPCFDERVLNKERKITAHPFVPSQAEERDLRCKEIFAIQVAGLAKRIHKVKRTSQIHKAVLGLSGGLDSTLALLVIAKAYEELGIAKEHIYTYTLPGFGTTTRTNTNAKKLAEALGVYIEEVDITKVATQELSDLRHDPALRDVTYENVQARYRTNFLMTKANQLRALHVGTGDLSELALGWCTFGGDHISFYNPNCGIPKTLVKYLVKWVLETQVDERTKAVLLDILNTPISPELVKQEGDEITQKTEDKIGPYELHDFFLYHLVRRGAEPKKILYLATQAEGWEKNYSKEEIKHWLAIFIQRFFNAQWKRSVATDGPKVGSVSLSPRGDWRMPSDAEAELWLKDLED